MRHRLTLGAFAIALIAGGASAQDQGLREELDRTREQVKQLLERVDHLEGRLAEQDGGVAAEVEAYLAQRGGGMPAGFNVSAPGVDALRFSGQIVWWWERFDEVYRPLDPGGLDDNDIGWLRSALRADADITDDLRAAIEIRDARAFGSEPSTVAPLQTPGAGTDLKEGWFEADDFVFEGTTVRAGRQVFSFGDQRVLGALDWHTYGRSFDGLRITRDYGDTRIDVLGARVVERGGAPVLTKAIDNDDRDIVGIYTRTPEALHHSDLDLYFLHVRDGADLPGEMPGATGTTAFQTAGFRIAGADGGAYDWGAEAAMQHGRLAGDSLRAYAVHARLGLTLTENDWKPRFGIEWNLATGDPTPGNGSVRAFQVLFPTNHAKYGIMDLLAWRNMQDFRAGVSFKPDPSWKVQADVHRLYLDESQDAWVHAGGGVIRPGAAGAAKFLGTEFDLVCTWTASEHMKVAIGGAWFKDGDFVRDTGPDGDSAWMYVRLTVNF